jgi:hypothetical protein
MERYLITVVVAVVTVLCDVHDVAGRIEKRLEGRVVDRRDPIVARFLLLYIGSEQELLLPLVGGVAQMEGLPIGTSYSDLILPCHYIVLQSAGALHW